MNINNIFEKKNNLPIISKEKFELESKNISDNKTESNNYNFIIGKNKSFREKYKDQKQKTLTKSKTEKTFNIEYMKNKDTNDKQMTKEENKEKDLKMLETRQVIREYLKNNYGTEPDSEENKEILNNYLKMLEQRYQGFKKFIIKFYNLGAAPPIL